MKQTKKDPRHTIKLIPIELGAQIDILHEAGHYLGVIPGKRGHAVAYLVYAIHPGEPEPVKKRPKA